MKLVLAGEELDPGIVLGWMLFPHSQELRELYLARNKIARVLETVAPADAV